MANDDILATWQEQIRADQSALVLVDLQNDFVHPEGWVAKQQVPGFLGDSGIVAALQRAEALLAAARDAGVTVVHVRMLGDDRYLSAPMRAQYLRNHGHPRPPCVQEGSWGADFYGDLRPSGSDNEYVVDKHRYSGFIGTRLDQLLRGNGIATIVVCGVATSGCVESTIRDGFMLDYYVVVAADACADYDTERHRMTCAKMDLSFGSVVSVAEIAGCWAARLAAL